MKNNNCNIINIICVHLNPEFWKKKANMCADKSEIKYHLIDYYYYCYFTHSTYYLFNNLMNLAIRLKKMQFIQNYFSFKCYYII